MDIYFFCMLTQREIKLQLHFRKNQWIEASSNDTTLTSRAPKTMSQFWKLWGSVPPYVFAPRIFKIAYSGEQKLPVRMSLLWIPQLKKTYRYKSHFFYNQVTRFAQFYCEGAPWPAGGVWSEWSYVFSPACNDSCGRHGIGNSSRGCFPSGSLCS